MFNRFATAIVVTAIALALSCSTAFALAAPDAYEPNETPATAVGPLTGGQFYQGGVQSALDRDYFYFYTAGPGNYNVSIVDYGTPYYYCRKDWVALTGSGDLLDYELSYGSDDIYSGTGGSSAVLSFTATSAAKIYIRVQGEPSPYCWEESPYWGPGPDKYTIRALPADRIAPNLPSPPPPPSEKCIKAKTASGKDASQIKKLKKSIAKSSGKKKKRLKSKLSKIKTHKAASDKRVKKYC